MKRRFAFFALVLGLSVLACQLIAGIDRVATEERPERQPDPPDVLEAAPPPPDPCPHALPPPPPLADDDPGVEKQLPSFYVALSEFHLLARDDAGAVTGFDLDGVCTCDKRPATAHEGGASCIGPVTCDLDGGIDNGSSTLFDMFGTIVPDLDQAANINKHISLGETGTLLAISQYNGRANDKAVNVGFIVSNGIDDGSGCGTNDGGPPPYPPGWCGNDIWTVDPTGVIGEQAPYAAALSAPAYVTNHTLVIKDPTSYFEVPFGDLRLRLYSPIVVATIVPVDANGNPRDPNAPPPAPNDRYYRLEDGRLAGRMAASTILAASGALREPRSSAPDAAAKYLCESTAFPILRSALCGARDIASTSQVDFDEKATCDALSATSSFRAQPALVGAKKSGALVVDNPCIVTGDSGSVAALYQCP